jgi:hypothetical protein
LKAGLANLELEKLKFSIEKQLKDAAVKAAEDKVTLVSSITNSIFRNIDVRRNIFGELPVINRNPDGSQWTSKESTNVMEDEHRD